MWRLQPVALVIMQNCPLTLTYRLDEILAGCILAIIYHRPAGQIVSIINKLNPIYLFPLLMISAHHYGGLMNYARPYIALLMVGSTLFVNHEFSNNNTWYQQRWPSKTEQVYK